MYSAQDERWMRQALRLASSALGTTAPNPCVGALVVAGNQVVGLGITAPGGRPHAETGAIAQAGSKARGASLYVTLEPCAHHGHTPPCTDAIIKAGIRRVIYGCADPDPRVAGQGVAALKSAGIEVVADLLRSEAHAINAGFLRRVQNGLPWTSLKIATSADGLMADAQRSKRWITGPRARAEGHLLRAAHEAIVTGIGTVLADNPLLTCRLPGLVSRSPVRVVVDPQLRLPEDCALVKTAREVPTWVCTTQPQADGAALERNGIRLLQTSSSEPLALLKLLAAEGINRVLVEAGPTLSSAFLAARAADTLYWFKSPNPLGVPGLSPFSSRAAQEGWKRISSKMLDEDRLEVYELPSCLPAL